MKKNRTTRARVASAMNPRGNKKQKKIQQEVKDLTVFVSKNFILF